MDVYEAVMSRRAVRGFTDQHVPRKRYSELRPHGPGAAPRDGHVRRGSSGRQRPSVRRRSQRRGLHRRQPRVMSMTRAHAIAVLRLNCHLALRIYRPHR